MTLIAGVLLLLAVAWWVRCALRTARAVIRYRARLGMGTHGALLACLVLWPVYLRQLERMEGLR